MMQAHNKKFKSRQFKEGNLVLKRILPNQHDPREKWVSNWQGSYVVKKAFSRRASILIEMDGEGLPSPVNFDAMKKYYA